MRQREGWRVEGSPGKFLPRAVGPCLKDAVGISGELAGRCYLFLIKEMLIGCVLILSVLELHSIFHNVTVAGRLQQVSLYITGNLKNERYCSGVSECPCVSLHTSGTQQQLSLLHWAPPEPPPRPHF